MSQRIAKRYAKAFLDYATEIGILEKLHTDFEALHQLLTESLEFKDFIQNSSIPSSNKQQILVTVLSSVISKESLQCLFFLEEKKRLFLLPQLIESFFVVYNDQEGIVKVLVTTSATMERQQQAALAQHLKLKFRKEIKAEFVVNSDLIGGIRVRVADKIYDHSFKAQLEEFEKMLN